MAKFKLKNICDLDVVSWQYLTADYSKIKRIVGEERNLNKNYNKALVIIDPQNDFVSSLGSLYVRKSDVMIGDLIKYIYENMDNIDKILVTLDSHYRNSIFFPMAWMKPNGERVEDFTVIDKNSDVIPTMFPDGQKEYLEYLESIGEKLTIWPYHCIIGTPGHCIENQLNQMLVAYEIYRDREVEKVMKGMSRECEQYGAVKSRNSCVDEWAKRLLKYDTIEICGEARDFCVYETVKQLCECYSEMVKEGLPKKIRVLYNLTDVIGDEQECEKKYSELVDKYGINIVNV